MITICLLASEYNEITTKLLVFLTQNSNKPTIYYQTNGTLFILLLLEDCAPSEGSILNSRIRVLSPLY